jgi:excisionase family DNA binding protein
MEKICIVKRRREYSQPEVKVGITQPEISENKSPEIFVSNIPTAATSENSENRLPDVNSSSAGLETNHVINPEFVTHSIKNDTAPETADKKIVEEFTDKSSSVIAITMTKEQSDLLRQSRYIKDLLNGTKSDPALEIKITPDGRLSLKYRFNDSLLLRMLAPNQVCQMLQVSRSFLQKNIHENRIKSYKIGRMRRFLLEDILDYLSNDADLSQFDNNQ